ncbi:MAG: hypothetical protein WBZ24_09030 [Anaerolineales bacterium]
MRRLGNSLSVCLALAMTLSFLPGATAFAQAPALPSCSGDAVSGTVVAVDSSTGLVTIEQSDGTQCTVSLNETYDQPIVGLLGSFFENVTPESLAAALDSLKTTIDCSSGPCTVSGDGSGTPATVQSVTESTTETGCYDVTFLVDGAGGTTETATICDAALAQSWADALNNLTADWTLTSDATGQAIYSGAGDEIAALHDDGMGFGVIVKLYAMAAQAQQTCSDTSGTTAETDTVNPCDVTVQGLVDAFHSGTGMGQLFKEYGKPAYLGVGHVRNGTPDSHGKPENPGKPDNPGKSDKPCNPHANSHSPKSCPSGD